VTRRWETALVALCLAVAGLVAFAIGFGGTATYESIMRAYAPATFHFVAGDAVPPDARIDLPVLARYHAAWFAYVTGDAQDPPISFGAEVFTRDEYAHMRDVRRVFVGARVLAVIAAAVAGLLLVRAWRRDARAVLVLARDASVVAGFGVAVLGLVASIAFDPLFLLFHRIVFPQGNFLFAPDSNLLAIYPDAYWYEVTIRVGLTFVAATVVIAVAAGATLRRIRR